MVATIIISNFYTGTNNFLPLSYTFINKIQICIRLDINISGKGKLKIKDNIFFLWSSVSDQLKKSEFWIKEIHRFGQCVNIIALSI